MLRNGGNTNRVAFTRVTDPMVGSLWKTDVDASGHSTSVAAIEVFQSPSSGFFLSGGELLVYVSSPYLLEVIQPHFGGTTSFSTGLPPDVTLFGLSASSQVAIFGSPGYEPDQRSRFGPGLLAANQKVTHAVASSVRNDGLKGPHNHLLRDLR